MNATIRRLGVRFLGCVVVAVAAALAAHAPPVAAADDDPGTDVTLTTDDKMTIAATRWSTSDGSAPGVVLLHMYKSDRTAWKPLVRHLHDRGFEVLAIDLRGHGGSAKQGKADLAPRVEKREVKLFSDMHKEAIAAVRYLVKDAACDPARISLVGASVGCSVAIDTARRYPKEIAAVACLSPGSNYLGLDSLAHAKTYPKDKPLLLLAHASEAEAGAPAVRDAIPGSRLITYDDAAPESAAGDPSWAHGTKMFGKIPLVEQTVASFLAAKTGSKKDDVFLDGLVAADGPDADPWANAVEIAKDGSGLRAYRVGRRIVFGGTVPEGSAALVLGFENGVIKVKGPDGAEIQGGVPSMAAIDIATGRTLWTYPGKEELGEFPLEMPADPPAVRIIKGPSGTTIEGEWRAPRFTRTQGIADSSAVKCAGRFETSAPERPSSANRAVIDDRQELKSR